MNICSGIIDFSRAVRRRDMAKITGAYCIYSLPTHQKAGNSIHYPWAFLTYDVGIGTLLHWPVSVISVYSNATGIYLHLIIQYLVLFFI